ncbi:hypothetical protein CXB77_08575 [Chromatium okenii]|uniref:Uncharacterized protein n=1 Tax=Chromatium okenii TaxID=61644 RepID=A0A2S7XQV1_9GAMM|nr:hypothetical protein CXB77_08575 [Chromatium okenii]
MQHVKPYWRMFTFSIIGMLIFAATEPLFAAMMKPLIDGSFVERNADMVRTMPLLVGYFGARHCRFYQYVFFKLGRTARRR